jgi:hypothetical protein
MRRATMFVMLVLGLAIPSAALAADKEDSQGRGWALDAKVGTLGFGADLSRSIVPRVLNLRVGASFFSYSTNITETNIDYAAKLKLGAIPIAVDVFPFKNWFRLGGGIVFNLNEVEGTGQANSGLIEIGDSQYTPQDIGQVNGKVKFNRAAPYIGLGFNNPIKRFGHVGFFADLGILYHGTPKPSLTTTKTIPGLQAEIDKELQQMNQDIKDYKIFPVLQLGLSYRF